MQMTLRDVLRAALSKNLPSGWVYLPGSDELLLDTPCLLLRDDPDAELDERGVPLSAVNQGFPTEGLDNTTIQDTAEWARQFIDPPPDDLLLASYAYIFASMHSYLRRKRRQHRLPPKACVVRTWRSTTRSVWSAAINPAARKDAAVERLIRVSTAEFITSR
jgi:hypothetical protein